MSSRSNSPHRPTAKRSPSILVTDSRTHVIKGARAPFAGSNFNKQQNQSDTVNLRKKLLRKPNRYADISVDKLLSGSSDIPSGQRRIPPSFSPPFSGMNSPHSPTLSPRHTSPPPMEVDKRMRSIPKLSNPLPTRTSKKSQKLVLIPDESNEVTYLSPPEYPSIQRSRAETMPKERRAQEFSRMTAYFICEEFNLELLKTFLIKKHQVKPRMYDETLYVPYSLPLLPGTDGYRIKSNNSQKSQINKKFMEKIINKSEQSDYLYEYYSGVETPEDANNYSMDPETENDSGAFDPSEPQYFAPEQDEEQTTQEQTSSPTATEDSTTDKEDYELSKHHGEMFIFDYGIVVFWNFSETHEKNILADLSFVFYEEDVPIMINPIDEQDIETEEFHFDYDETIHRPRIYNDMITLRSADHLIKLTMSHAIAQSTKLGLFESRMINILTSISRLPKKLALTGELGLRRDQLLKKSGKLFKLRSDVNLSGSILDTPNFFWDFEPALHPLYSAVRDYLDIDQRVQVINDRCKVFLEFSDIVNDSINEKNTSRITFMFILIIFLSLSVSLFEFVLEVI
ncbi:sporulation protein Rmd8p [[Candida] jaroonii]|uniref:Sporulation protein Rmd8p n=1 Tax=[Candida] jaroonii TaxID=467808 RepID=A0ACA9YFD1_9ASCO|nr:sporulation protein Rmd8p [[Candida] jaroonii]